MKTLALLFVTLTLSACASISTNITKLSDSQCSGKTSSVELFMKGEMPKKSYKKIALISVDNSKDHSYNESELFDELKKQAMNSCADAIVIQEINDTSDAYALTGSYGPIVGSQKTTIIRGLAVKYE